MLSKIIQSTALAVVVCDAGCLMHINGLHRRGKNRPVHIAEVLANA
jgi:hypothetical protein